MTKLVLHIGIHRTGTTGLQRNLSLNRERLLKRGIAYPFEGNNHQEIAWKLHRGEMTGMALAERLQPYANCSQIILSGEDFCIQKSLDWLESLKQEHEVEAIIYLRRQDDWLMSWYNQHIKWPFSRRHSTMTPNEFLACLHEFHWLDFDKTVSRWEAMLGEDKVQVRIMEKAQITDTVTDFFSLIGVPADEIEQDNSTHNDSLPIETLEFARKAGLMDMKPGRRLVVVNFLRDIGKSSKVTGKTLYTAAQRQAVLDQFADSSQALARRRFARDALFLEGPPDDRSLYIEGAFAEQNSVEDLMMKTLAFLGRER